MKHASANALDRLEPLLMRLRALDGLSERKRGIFYLRSKAFLHFHEDPDGLFADIRLTQGDFERFRVEGPAEQENLLKLASEALLRWRSGVRLGRSNGQDRTMPLWGGEPHH